MRVTYQLFNVRGTLRASDTVTNCEEVHTFRQYFHRINIAARGDGSRCARAMLHADIYLQDCLSRSRAADKCRAMLADNYNENFI